MEIQYSPEKGGFKDPNDLKRPGAFDVGQPKVQRHSIGWLDENYLNGRRVVQPRVLGDSFTRVPPITTLSNPFDRFNKLSSPVALITAALASVWLWTRTQARATQEFVWARMPKHYSESRGTYIDWTTFRESLARVAAVSLVVLLLLIGLVAYTSSSTTSKTKTSVAKDRGALTSSSKGQLTATGSQSSTSTSTSTSSSSTTSSGSTSTGGSSAVQPSGSSTSSYSSTGSTSTGSTTNHSPTSTTSSSSGLLPATDTTLGGKTVEKTSPIGSSTDLLPASISTPSSTITAN